MSAEVYVSTDIEADGPIPGSHSMLSIGSAAYTADGTLVATFTANLQELPEATADPDTTAWWAGQPEAWEAARRDPQPPRAAMHDCKLDWVIADAGRGDLTNASNMLDVTWEAPDGTITPLDGYLDGYFQEIYLDAGSAPIFDKLVKQVSSDSLDEYMARLEGEVKKYFGGDSPNYGKAAKRLYNVFRLNGRYEEAAFLRELFDEPVALLYQVHALVRTIEEATVKSKVFSIDNILNQMDDLVLDVVKVLEGEDELEVVRHLLRLYRALARQAEGLPLGPHVEAAQAELLNLVNNFFYDRMTAVPAIHAYLEGLKA